MLPTILLTKYLPVFPILFSPGGMGEGGCAMSQCFKNVRGWKMWLQFQCKLLLLQLTQMKAIMFLAFCYYAGHEKSY